MEIKDLKARLDVVQVLRDRGFELKPRGENLFMCCVFHQEKSASLSVNPATGLWKCFGCGAGGDVITFIAKVDGITAWAAANKLCAQYFPGERLLRSDKAAKSESLAESAPEVEHPGQAITDQIVQFWQKALGASRKAEAYLKSRRLWSPELLRALRIGFANGKLIQVLPKEGKIHKQLVALGVVNERSTEVFYNRLVVPLLDENGVLVGIYGRAIDESSSVPHLYLRGPRRGVFNRAGIPDGGTVILTESILDALSLLVLGLTNVTTSYGVNGFTPELRQLLVERRVTRVFCVYDADDAGNQAAEILAQDLAGAGIAVFRVALPVKDANEFLMQGGTRPEFEQLLEQAVQGAKEGPTAGSESMPAPAEGTPVADPLAFTFGARTYQLAAEPRLANGVLKVALQVTGYSKKPFRDSLNLYSDTARMRLQARLFTHFRGQVSKEELEEDLFALLEGLVSRGEGEDEPQEAKPISPEDEREAMQFLLSPDLIEILVADITHLGVVGEEDNKLLAYLVATSRKLSDPVSLSVISRSSAGKSWLINRVVDLMPPEDVFRYTRMSPRALFYNEPDRFKHKILFVEEAIGAKDADLGVRSIQSERRLANLATTTDPKTGKLTTQENVVEGPLTYLTSSTAPLDDETETRSFEIAIDESSAQTKRIVTNLFHRRTLEGRVASLDRDEIVRRHQNAQRLLSPTWVVNSYSPQLTFPTETLRLRREADKYLSLIETLAFLHQKQRPVKSFGPKRIPYIEVTVADIDRANRLTVKCLARALSGLPGPTQELLIKIRHYVVQKADGRSLLDVRFTRGDIREATGWTSDRQMLAALETLMGREYVHGVQGSFGKEYIYLLGPDHRLVVQPDLPIERQIVELGLTPAETLVDSATFAGSANLDAPSRTSANLRRPSRT